jgi:hypothetical protein
MKNYVIFRRYANEYWNLYLVDDKPYYWEWESHAKQFTLTHAIAVCKRLNNEAYKIYGYKPYGYHLVGQPS